MPCSLGRRNALFRLMMNWLRLSPLLTSPFLPTNNSGWSETSALVFLGELRNCNGGRLVVVKLEWAVDMSVPITGPGQDCPDELTLCAWVLRPATLIGPPRYLNSDCFPATFSKSSGYHATSGTIYAGQRDPSDPRRLTMHYNYDGHPGLFAAVLGNDDHLHFSQLSGPSISAWNPQFGRSKVVPNPR